METKKRTLIHFTKILPIGIFVSLFLIQNLNSNVAKTSTTIIEKEHQIGEININKNQFYVRKGFKLKWIKSIPYNNKDFLVVKPSPDGKVFLRIKDLNLPGLPKRSYGSFTEYKPQSFTYISSFHLDKENLLGNKPLALYIPTIGINWEVYLNGHSIKSQIF